MQTKIGKRPVHECRSTGEVTRVFQQRHQEKQNHDLREEHRNSPNSANDALSEEAADHRIRQHSKEQIAGI